MATLKPSLTDPYLKATRAKEHLEALRQEVNAFYKSKPGTFTGEDDLKKGQFRIRITVKDPPDRIAIILGDLLYCLRSSLDQLNWSLCQLTPVGQATKKKIQFPILKVPNKHGFLDMTDGMPAGARDIIEELQPYYGRNANNSLAIRSHLLWQLNRLHIVDKHHRIHVVGSATDFRFSRLSQADFGRLTFDHDNSMIIVPLDLKAKMALDPKISLNVLFTESQEGIECTFDGIEAIYNFVANSVIPRFACFFT